MNAQPYDDWTAQLAQWAQEWAHGKLMINMAMVYRAFSGDPPFLCTFVTVSGDPPFLCTYVAPDV